MRSHSNKPATWTAGEQVICPDHGSKDGQNIMTVTLDNIFRPARQTQNRVIAQPPLETPSPAWLPFEMHK